MATPTATEILAALDQAIYDLTVGGVAQTTVNGQTYEYHDLDKLTRARKYYAGRVAAGARSSRGAVTLIKRGEGL